jgi:hypothetical protein
VVSRLGLALKAPPLMAIRKVIANPLKNVVVPGAWLGSVDEETRYYSNNGGEK